MPKQPAYDEYTVFMRLGKSDQHALQEIMDNYFSDLSGLINGIIKNEEQAKEILEDTYMRLWDNRKVVSKMENPGGWLYKTALFNSLNALKKEKRTNTVYLNDNSIPSNSGNLNNEMDVKEVKRQIELSIEQLSPQKKLIYKLSREYGLSRKEIAEKLDISESTVKNHLTEALKQIREVLSKLLNFLLI